MRQRLHPLATGVIALLALAIGLATVASATAASAASERRAIIVLVDNVSLTEVAASGLRGFSALGRRGSVGLSTVPLGATGRNAAAYAVIGNGSPAPVRAVTPELANGFGATETVEATTAAAAWARTTGASTAAGIVNPNIVAFMKAFAEGGGGPSAGALGSSLQAAGLSSALIGNADGTEAAETDRSATLVAMDAVGTVATGAVGASVIASDVTRPLGVRTDFDRVYELTRDALAGSSLVVVETGDLQRARIEAAVSTTEAAARSRERALADTDAFLQRLVPLADENTLMVVVSTSVPASEGALGRSLGPIFIAGGSFPAGGILGSATTRRPGVLTLHDIAPTVLAHLGVTPIRPMTGLTLSGRMSEDASASLFTTLQRAGALHSQRASAIAAFILAQTVLLLALCVPWVQRRIVGGRWWWVLPYISGSAALATVLAPAFGSPELGTALGVVSLIALALAIGFAAVRNRVLALGVLASATAGALALDLAFGAPLARWSYLGYDLVVGGRFYGVGNEYEGVLVGASVVGAACLVALAGRHRRFAVGAVGAGCLALIGIFAMPGLGADAGGALAAALGVGVTFYGFAGGRFTWRRVFALAGVLVALGITGIALSSALSGSTGSHAGRFLDRLSSGDVTFVTTLLLGKLRANGYLLASSPWRSVLLAAAAALAVLGGRYRSELRAAFVTSPDLARGVPGLIAGGIGVLLLNDSGVIALATLAPFAVLLVLTLVAVAPPATPERPTP